MNNLIQRRPAQRGISLIEMLVGVAIGVLCVLTIVQLLSAWEARKRSVTSGNDSQMSGTLGSFSIDRELRLAGHGFGMATVDVMGCQVNAFNSARTPNDITFNLRPVEIVKSAGKPDEIHVLYGNSAYFVASQPLLSSGAETKSLKSREGFNAGDRVVVTTTAPVLACALIEVTGDALADAVTIEHKAGAGYTTLSGAVKTSTMNAAGGTGTTFSTGRVFNLGPAPVQAVWSVDTTKHTLTRYDRFKEAETAAVDVASDVVTLRAQYGIDTSDNGVIESTEWVDVAPVATNWTQVRAVRFAMLVRSRQYERVPDGGGPVTPTAPKWGATGESFEMKNIDNSTDSGSSAVTGASAVNNWRNYRYRVYEEVVPLRNMIWGTAP